MVGHHKEMHRQQEIIISRWVSFYDLIALVHLDTVLTMAITQNLTQSHFLGIETITNCGVLMMLSTKAFVQRQIPVSV